MESAEEFVRLRMHDDLVVQRRAALEEAPEHVWREVVDRYPEMRVWVVHNKTVPLPILELLSTDEDRAVRGAVAGKRKLSRELFERLAADPDEGVRLDIGRNPKVPLDILEGLTRDPSAFVASEARRILERRES